MDEMDSQMSMQGLGGASGNMHLHNGGASQTSQFQSQKQMMGTAGYSPFRPPNDEEVFITRETEKQKRKEAKEKAKNLKIWDKKTATSRVPLKKVKDSDIQPAQIEENLYNFNSTQRGYISAAMHIAKSRVQFPREQRPQNINEFIDQKKEMFLVELSNNTIKKEIEELDHKSKRKAIALKDSSNQLENDHIKLMKFIEQDNITTQDKEKEAEKMTALRKKKEAKIKKIDTRIANLKSEIEKNKDVLTGLEAHKDFLIELSHVNWITDQEKSKKFKRDKIKKEWIDFHKKDRRDDNLIFRDNDDELFTEAAKGGGQSVIGDAALTQKSDNNTGTIGGGLHKQSKKGQQIQQLKRETMTDKDWESKFEMLFREDLIDLPEDFFNEELFYKDPNDLNNIFSELEEKNLYLIHMSQEVEQSLENQKQQYQILQEKLGKEMEIHSKNKRNLEDQINESNKSLYELKKRSSVNTITNQGGQSDKDKDKKQEEVDVNIEELLNDLKKDILKVYKNTIDPHADLHAKQTLDILTDIEIHLENYMKEIRYIEHIDENEVNKEEKGLKGIYKKDQRERSQKEKMEMNEKKNAELRARMDRVYQKLGRTAMPRSMKKKVKREKAEVKIDEHTLDRMRYLGQLDPMEQPPTK